MSGPALMFIRFFERTGDANLLDLAATAIRMDLDRCVTDKNGALHVDEGSRILPYLARGSVGIGMVIDDYLAHRGDDRFAEAREGIRRAAHSVYYAQSGLFSGRAGMLLHLARQGDPRRPRTSATWPGTPSRTRAAWPSQARTCSGSRWTWAPGPPASCSRSARHCTTGRSTCRSWRHQSNPREPSRVSETRTR